MKNMNFLTNKYKEKLEIEEFLQKNILYLVIIGFFIVIAYFAIKPIEMSIEKKIRVENLNILKDEENIGILEIKLKEKTNLNQKIEVIENIFSKKHLKISDFFESLDESVPDNIWLEELIYENERVRIKGFSLGNGPLTPEENIYYFEKRIKNSGLYEIVSMTYLKQGMRYGEKVNEFEYMLDLK